MKGLGLDHHRCQNQLEIRNDGALTHYKYGFIHETTWNFYGPGFSW